MADDKRHAQAEREHGHRDHAVQRHVPTYAGTQTQLNSVTPSPPMNLLGNARLNGRGNSPVRQALLQRMQQALGNRATQRAVQRLSTNSSPPTASAAPHASQPSIQRLFIQREVKPMQVVKRIQNELGRYDVTDKVSFKDMQKMAKEIAEDPTVKDETDDTLIDKRIDRKVRTHPTLAPIIKEQRMVLRNDDMKDLKEKNELESKITEVINSITFYHGTSKENAASIRTTGLDPNRGGGEGGASDKQSINAAVRKENVSASKGKVFVTRTYNEAKGYFKDGPVLRVFIPQQWHSDLQVDPDSQYGLYIEKKLAFIEGEGGELPAAVVSGISKKLDSKYEAELIKATYKDLKGKGLFGKD